MERTKKDPRLKKYKRMVMAALVPLAVFYATNGTISWLSSLHNPIIADISQWLELILASVGLGGMAVIYFRDGNRLAPLLLVAVIVLDVGLTLWGNIWLLGEATSIALWLFVRTVIGTVYLIVGVSSVVDD